MTAVDEQLAAARAGDRRALARLLSVAEAGGDAGRELARVTFPQAGRAWTVGITGAPGAGKSTLTSALVAELRGRGDTVAVLAIDPSSPFSGGALLGDRVRMGDHALDPGVFIRSMATRGHLGGLAAAAPEAIRVLDAAGFDWVVVETVGVGQVEVAVARATDTTVVVLNPGWGDAVQAAKAGLLEVADLFVINKADRPGAAEARADLERMLGLSGDGAPPILLTSATAGAGVGELASLLHRGREGSATGAVAAKRAARLEAEVDDLLVARLRRQLADRRGAEWDDVRREVRSGRLDPWAATDRLLGEPGRD